MKVNLDRYFELEERYENESITPTELIEWKQLNTGIMDNQYIENLLKNDNLPDDHSKVKRSLDRAFSEKFGGTTDKNVQQQNIIPLSANIRKLWAPPVNWTAVASVAAVFAIFFMLKPSPSIENSSLLLADSSLHVGADTTTFSPDSLIN